MVQKSSQNLILKMHDDLIIATTTISEDKNAFCEVMKAIADADLTLNAKKMCFGS